MEDRSVFVSAPVSALVQGLYRERTTVADVLRHGDLGLGTFNDLDGEMIVVDGRAWQIRADGTVHRVFPSERTPYACVTMFRPETEEAIRGDRLPAGSDGGVFDLVERLLPSPNMLYALRIDGEFAGVRTRSVPKQEVFRPLVEVAREQPEFEFETIRGTMVGFATPQFLETVTVAGIHLHLLSADRERGGHLLAARVVDAVFRIQHVPALTLGLPMNLDYLTADLDRDVAADLDEAER